MCHWYAFFMTSAITVSREQIDCHLRRFDLCRRKCCNGHNMLVVCECVGGREWEKSYTENKSQPLEGGGDLLYLAPQKVKRVFRNGLLRFHYLIALFLRPELTLYAGWRFKQVAVWWSLVVIILRIFYYKIIYKFPKAVT